MFLKKLNLREREMFLELAYLIAKIDGEVARQEKDMMEEYREEMSINASNYKIMEKSKEEILDFFSKSTKDIQKAVFFEAIVIALSDKKYKKEENEVILSLKSQFGISDEEYEDIIGLLCKLNQINKKLDEYKIGK